MQMTVFTQGMEVWLLRTEQRLRKQLSSGEVPFLGLYADLFTDSARRKLQETLGHVRDPFATYLRAIEKWPATFAAYLTIHVVEGFGASGDAAVYPFVSSAIFGTQRHDLSHPERDRLWQTYRRACIRLGLDVLPMGSVPNYMVAEYLHQAGIPVSFLPRIAKRMLNHATVAGVPEADDPQGIALWQETLLDRLGPPIPVTARRAVEADHGGYYTRLFLRALGHEPVEPVGADRSIYQSVLNAISIDEADHGRVLEQRLTIPKVVLRDDLLGVELPAGAGWRIATDDAICEYEAGTEPRFIPFDLCSLPGSARIERSDGQWIREFPLWDDGRNNRLLAFDSAGLLAGASRLNADVPLMVEPGGLTLLTRFRPEGCDTELTEVSSEPALYRLSLDLAPGESVRLHRGHAEVSIIARSHPTLTLSGQTFRGIGGNLLRASGGLLVHGQVPIELLEGANGGRLQAELSTPGLGDPVEVTVEPDPEGAFEIDPGPICAAWRPGLGRLSVVLRRIGLRRSIARTATWLWNGVERIEDRVRFHCSRLPGNLDRDTSDNLTIDASRNLVGFQTGQKRYFHLVFDLSTGRQVRFTGAVPGAFMRLARFHDGRVQERPLRRGAVLAVREGSREVLEVYSSQGGILTLGGMRQEIPQVSGLKHLHLSSLAQYLEPGVDRLCIEYPDGVFEPLLRLVAPHRVLGMRTDSAGGILRIRLDLPAAAELVRCTATDVLTGTERHLDLACNDVSARLDGRSLAWLACSERRGSGRYPHTLELPLERWPSGAWLLHVEARLKRRWGSLVNTREDIFAWGMVLDESGAPAAGPWLAQRLTDPASGDAIAIFKRVHRALLPCYAPEVWPELCWLAEVWRRLAEGLVPGDGQVLTELLALDALTPPESSQQGWFPILGVGSTLPWIYARPAAAYSGARGRAGLLGELSRIRPPLCDLFVHHLLEPTLATGFDNVIQMQCGAPPAGFSMSRYREALGMRNIDDAWSLLSREDWHPAEGDYLGPVHWRFAQGATEHRYRATLAGNEARRGWACQLLRCTTRWSTAAIAEGLPAHLDLSEGIDCIESPDMPESDQERLNLLGIDRLLCQFAAVCRWEPRVPGTLAAWRRALETINLPDANALELALGYLLHIGRDTFEFYLLLWELVFAADADTLDEDSLHG
jgi:hypothetical protein